MKEELYLKIRFAATFFNTAVISMTEWQCFFFLRQAWKANTQKKISLVKLLLNGNTSIYFAFLI